MRLRRRGKAREVLAGGTRRTCDQLDTGREGEGPGAS